MAGASAAPAIFRRSARSTRGATAACAGAALLSLISSSARLAQGARFFTGSPHLATRREAFAPPPSFLTALHHGYPAMNEAASWRCDARAGRGGLGCRVASHRGLLRVLQLRGGATARGCSSAGGGGAVGVVNQEGETRLELRIDDVDGTWEIAEAIADAADAGDVVLLEGEVGAGKTTFARGFIRAFTGDPDATVASPSFLLHLQYPGGPCTLHHLDLYRLLPDRDLAFLGLEEVLPTGVSLIEWPSPKLAHMLPESLLKVHLTEEAAAAPAPEEGGGGEEGEFALPEMDAPRRLTLVAKGAKWQAWLQDTFPPQ